MASGDYTTPDAVRAELGFDQAALPDAAAAALITDAQAIIDGLLGGRRVNIDTGRKVTQDAVAAWQWTALGRATVMLAARLYREPSLLASPGYASVSGPDFALSGRLASSGGDLGVRFMALLNATGLRRGMSRSTMRPHHGGPPWLGFAINLDQYDDEDAYDDQERWS